MKPGRLSPFGLVVVLLLDMNWNHFVACVKRDHSHFHCVDKTVSWPKTLVKLPFAQNR